ncbi:MAG: dihydroorotase [Methylococcaceae bacterium]|nr:dihydroorotase [Methylococcaceae bacterium]
MSKILIQNGQIIDPANQLDCLGSVAVAEGKIIAVITAPADFTPDLVIDATGHVICPGFIDLSTRLREPGQSRKATFNSEINAAASAGITAMCLQPDTHPVIDNPAVVELIKGLGEQCAYENIYPIAALTYKLAGQELSAMLGLKQADCIAVSNANQPVQNLLVLRRAMEYAASHDLLLMFRPQDLSLSNQGCVHEGAISTRYGLPGIPEAAETIALAQCLELTELTGCRVHFSQLSGWRSIIKIQQAKKYGLKVSADVAMHQLHLTEDDIEPFNSAYHVIPPFRSQKDREALRDALSKGIIEAICSDHQPHDLDAKLGAFPETAPGISALETLLPLMLKLVNEGVCSLSQGIAALTQKPAAIIRQPKGSLSIGACADICVFDPTATWQVTAQNWRSQGKNTPYWGQTLTGKVAHTLQSGEIIFSTTHNIRANRRLLSRNLNHA